MGPRNFTLAHQEPGKAGLEGDGTKLAESFSMTPYTAATDQESRRSPQIPLIAFTASVGLLTLVSGLAACVVDNSPDRYEYEEPACERSTRYYRIVDAPVTKSRAEAQELALDMDGDSAHDNAVGDIASLIYSQFESSQTTWEAIRMEALAGSTTWLITLSECEGDYREVGLGEARDSDQDGRYELVGPNLNPSVGTQAGDRILTRDGQSTVPLGALFDIRGGHSPGWTQAIGFASDLQQSGSLITGRIVVGFVPDNAIAAISPSLRDFFTERLQAGTSAVAELFDSNKDGEISTSEFAESPIVGGTRADLDLLASYKGEPHYWPNEDGVRDHISLTLEVTAELVQVE